MVTKKTGFMLAMALLLIVAVIPATTQTAFGAGVIIRAVPPGGNVAIENDTTEPGVSVQQDTDTLDAGVIIEKVDTESGVQVDTDAVERGVIIEVTSVEGGITVKQVTTEKGVDVTHNQGDKDVVLD